MLRHVPAVVQRCSVAARVQLLMLACVGVRRAQCLGFGITVDFGITVGARTLSWFNSVVRPLDRPTRLRVHISIRLEGARAFPSEAVPSDSTHQATMHPEDTQMEPGAYSMRHSVPGAPPHTHSASADMHAGDYWYSIRLEFGEWSAIT